MIHLTTPMRVRLPIHPGRSTVVTDVIVGVHFLPGYHVHTDVWLGSFDARTHRTLYEDQIIPGDPFRLASGECG